MIVVRVPASTANLGPAFDGLGMALSLHAEVGVLDDRDTDGSAEPDDGVARPALPERARVVDERHPADVAFRRGGGQGRLWVRSPIPMGRGLGYSGAMRVGGLVAAVAQANGLDALDRFERTVLGLAAELEGHGDNVGASLLGGVVAVADGHAVRVPLAIDPAVTVWVPSKMTTSTDRSRSMLSSSVSFRNAVFNVTRTALLVAALAAGDVDALAEATQDRLHQDLRFAAVPASRAALAAGLEAGAWCGWLSGSGPAVALLGARDQADALAGALPADGTVKQLSIDRTGAAVNSM